MRGFVHKINKDQTIYKLIFSAILLNLNFYELIMQMIPFDKMNGYIWIDGVYKKWRESNVHVLNHGLHYGSCVFEGIRIYQGKIFKLEEHTDRLFRSADLLDLKIPYTQSEINEITYELTKKQKVLDGYIGQLHGEEARKWLYQLLILKPILQ